MFLLTMKLSTTTFLDQPSVVSIKNKTLIKTKAIIYLWKEIINCIVQQLMQNVQLSSTWTLVASQWIHCLKNLK